MMILIYEVQFQSSARFAIPAEATFLFSHKCFDASSTIMQSLEKRFLQNLITSIILCLHNSQDFKLSINPAWFVWIDTPWPTCRETCLWNFVYLELIFSLKFWTLSWEYPSCNKQVPRPKIRHNKQASNLGTDQITFGNIQWQHFQLNNSIQGFIESYSPNTPLRMIVSTFWRVSARLKCTACRVHGISPTSCTRACLQLSNPCTGTRCLNGANGRKTKRWHA